MSDTRTLAEMCEIIIDCEHKTAPTQEKGFPSIRTPNIGRGRFLLEGVNRVDEEIYRTWTRRAVPRDRDLVLAREAPVGNVAIITKGLKVCLGQRTVLIRPDKSRIMPHYLLYLLLGDEIQGKFHSFSGGATVAHLNMKDIRNLALPRLPNLNTQCKIASILSAYDDLIENNLRRIKILEKMAQNLYREWFVKFRFPGHQHARFVNSPMGRIPEGWEVSILDEHLVALESGKRPRGGAQKLESGVPSVGAENVSGIGKHNYQSEKYVSREFFEGMRKGVVEDGDVALYKDGAYIGRSAYFRDGFPHVQFCINEHVFLLRTTRKNLTQNMLYLWLQEPDTVSGIRATNANAAQPGINQTGVRGLSLIVPPADISGQFDQLAEPSLALIISLAKRNEALRNTRDLLLPRLISGEVDVSDLDITVPEETMA